MAVKASIKKMIIYRRCETCLGEGVVLRPSEDGYESVECPVCKGEGQWLWGEIKEEN